MRYRMGKSVTTFNDLDPRTREGLMRVIMEAHYNDALNAQSAFRNGNKPQLTTNVQTLQQSLVGLIDAVGEAMRNGELTPFHGNYVDWLSQKGFIDKPQVTPVENIMKERYAQK